MAWTESLAATWRRLRGRSPQELNAERAAIVRRIPAPTFWLLGKTGSGKSSLVRLLTGTDDIAIGSGFRPTTREASIYSFPDPDTPIMHFLDTRGLGEAGYDAEADITALAQRSQAIIVTHRLRDFATQSVVAPLQAIRTSSRELPILLALTCLHEAYPQQPHPPYPFHDSLFPDGLPECVARPLTKHLNAFAGLTDAIVPVDITRPEEGFSPADYGGGRFIETLLRLLPASYQVGLRGVSSLRQDLHDLHEQAALPYVHGSALFAATAALAPLPWVDIPVVAGIQTHMVHAIARVYRQQATISRMLELFAAAGIGCAARLGVRGLLKMVPYVGTIAGGVLGATLAYSYTYALGRACCWYHERVLAGHEPTRAEISEVFHEHWHKGKEIWKSLKQPQATSEPGP